MVKREKADSGLRAGFIHEDELKAQPASNGNASQTSAPATVAPVPAPPVEKTAETAATEAAAPLTGPKTSVQGVSGKMITGVIKAIRKHRPAEKKAGTSGPAAASGTTPPAAEKVVEKAQPATPAAAPAEKAKGPLTAAAQSPAAAKTGPAAPSQSLTAAAPAAAAQPVAAEKKETVTVPAAQSPLSPQESAAKPAPHPATAAAPANAPTANKPAGIGEKENKSTAAPAAGPGPAPAASPAVGRKAAAKSVVHPQTRTASQTAAAQPRLSSAAPAPMHPQGQHAAGPAAQSTSPRTAAVQRPQSAVHAASRPAQAASPIGRQGAGTSTPQAGTPTPKEAPRVKRDEGIILSAAERMAQLGKTPIRPQSGRYLGQNAATPAFSERRGQSGRGRSGGASFGGRSGYGQGYPAGRGGYGGRGGQGAGYHHGPSGGFRGAAGGMGKDKDEEETPRRTRSPKQQKSGGRFAAPVEKSGEDAKSASRRTFQTRDKGSRNAARSLSEKWRENQEIELDEEIVRRGRRRKARTEAQQQAQTTQPAKASNVKLPETMTVKELAELLKKTSVEVIGKLMNYGIMANINQEIDYDTAEVIAGEFGIQAEKIVEITEEQILFDDSEDKEEDLLTRPPVVVIMGHVDHGKTSILDWIRNTHVAAGEAGGITQHIGAYQADVSGRKITFLDTPGHEAFTAMRARGAQVTDIAVLVVAADDGVMPQTKEAIHHARAAETEIIVAINKIDKANANIDRVKQELAAEGLIGSEWGGNTTMIPVSAKTGQNMDELLEMILLTADVLDLKANPRRQAKGTIIEARLDRARGPVATLLVQRGTLRQGDTIVAGTLVGNVRAMADYRGEPIKEAGPSVPVQIMGLPDVPEDGDIFYAVDDERMARSLASRRAEEERERQLKRSTRLSMENLFEKMNEGETKDLSIIIKADLQGSVEALTGSLEKLSNEEVRLHVLHGAVGAITTSDVRLADVSDAIIIGFNVRPAAGVTDLAQEANVEIRLYSIIYDAIEEMEAAMKGLLAPEMVEEVLGHAEVRETYKVSGVGTVAGCYVTDGKINRRARVRIVRDGIVIHDGELASLRRFKDDVREVASGYECGIGIDRYNDIKIGDVFEAYQMKEVARS